LVKVFVYQKTSCFKGKRTGDWLLGRGSSVEGGLFPEECQSAAARRFHAKYKWKMRVFIEIIVQR
jgi:hypothetical protein